MPFGLINVLMEFQKIIDIAYNRLQREVLIYIDDLLVFLFKD